MGGGVKVRYKEETSSHSSTYSKVQYVKHLI